MIMNRFKKQIILTPTKCGTVTLQIFYRTPGTDAERDRDSPGWQFQRMRHGMVMPQEVYDELDKWTVMIATRHPVNRLLSIFQYIRGNPGGWGAMREYVKGSFTEFVEKFFEVREAAGEPDEYAICRAPFIWINNLTENCKYLGPVQALKQENFAALGITSHSNISKHRFVEKDVFAALPRELQQKVHDWAMPDIITFGYEPKPWQYNFYRNNSLGGGL
jgi:hypothetical protein